MTVPATAQSTLTDKEKKDGWKLLFDGTTTKGWKTFNSDSAVTAWKAADGTLMLDSNAKKDVVILLPIKLTKTTS